MLRPINATLLRKPLETLGKSFENHETIIWLFLVSLAFVG